MPRGLEGRRIAVFAGADAALIAGALEQHGARVELLSASTGGEGWHGGRYAALVITAASDEANEQPRLVQLLREFLVSDKPVAVLGEGLRLLERAGGTVDDAVLAETGDDARGFADRTRAALAARLDDREADEMSEQSFPASDPPSTTPSSVGRVSRENEPDARP